MEHVTRRVRLPRRHFLGLVAVPAGAAALRQPAESHGHVALAAEATGDRRQAVDPQIERLRRMALDETVEPALIFLPGRD
jgi:hypothetical protein